MIPFDLNSHVIVGTMDFSELKDGPPAPNTLAGCIQWYISSKNLPEPIIPTNFPKKLQGAMGKSSSRTFYPYEPVQRSVISTMIFRTEIGDGKN